MRDPAYWRAVGTTFMPTITSAAVMALVFWLLFNVYNGEINRFLMFFGLIKEPVS
ncbi:MAG: hypothetical protein LBD96_06005 [Treponema sp.]|jgi:raffinose/stachyose/melibiose transport system permease protein|nr:hypothetical protein [Treponema sp.]